MANEIRLTHTTASRTDLYVVIRAKSGILVWDGSSMVAWDNANLASYALFLTDQNGDLYTVDAPTTLPAGEFELFFYVRAGGSPAITDTLLETQDLSWTGSEVTPAVLQPDQIAGKTTLNAVNEIIGAIGTYPVATLDTGGSSDAALAETILNRSNEEIQSRGWHCNREAGRILTPEVDNTIPLASNMLRVDSLYGLPDVCAQNGLLYDITNRTTQFTAPVTVKTILLREFGGLPPMLKGFIVADAAVQFQVERLGSRKVHAFTIRKRDQMELAAMKEDSEIGGYNILNTTIGHEIRGRHDGPVLHR